MKDVEGRRDAGGWRLPGLEKSRRWGGGDPRDEREGSPWGGRSPGKGGAGSWGWGEAGLGPKTLSPGEGPGGPVAGWAWLLDRATDSGWRIGDRAGCPCEELCLPA